LGVGWLRGQCGQMVLTIVTLPPAERAVTQALPHGQMTVERGESTRRMTGAVVGRPRYSRSAVPPVGVEPTLGTLLGGRPLPLGYGGVAMIPRTHVTIPDNAIRKPVGFYDR
jgi:hypothetical protein